MHKWLCLLALVASACNEPSPSNDGSVNPPVDAAAGDGSSPMLSGQKLLDGKTSTVLDTTTDDYAVVKASTGTTTPLQAINLADGTAQMIDPAYQKHSTQGQAVFSWSAVDTNSNAGTLTVWTAAAGAHVLSTASTAYDAALSADGAFVLFADNATTDGSTLDFAVARSDGTGKLPTSLAGRSASPDCPPGVAFAGGRFFVSSCTNAGDMGVSLASIDLVDPATGATTNVQSGVQDFFAVDSAGHKLLLLDASNHLQLWTIGSDTPVAIDSSTVVQTGFIAADGTVVYQTMDGTLKAAKVQSPTSVMLSTLTTGANVLQALSPDNRFLLYSSTYDATQSGGDLSLLPVAGGAPQKLIATGGFLFGDPFSSDSGWVLWFANLQTDGTGALFAQPTAGGAVQMLGSSVWNEAAGAGSTLLYSDNFSMVGSSGGGRADLHVVDLNGGTPTLIATQYDTAPQDFLVSASKRYVLYSYSATKPETGVYAFRLTQ